MKRLLTAGLALSLALGPALSSAAQAGPKYGKGYYGGHGYYGHHYRGGYRFRGGYGYRRHHGHAGVKAGYALLGFGLGVLLSNASRRSDPYYNGGYVRVPAEPPRYVPPPVQQAPQPASEFGADVTCLQTREYQTVVIIGGEEHEAYGTACLQPDGSWLQGPVKVPPEYAN